MFDYDEKKLVNKVIDENYLNEGDYVKKFEKKIASYLGVKYCVCVTSGTAAISLALMTLGLLPDDEVIIPNFTFIATANAVKLAGAKPIFVDINFDRFDISIKQIKKKITKKTKVIIPVDVNGRSADYKSLEFLKENLD